MEVGEARLDRPAVPFLEHRHQQAFLAAEVLEQGRVRDADPFRDAADRAAREAELAEYLDRRTDDLLASADPRAVGPTSRRAVGGRHDQQPFFRFPLMKTYQMV